MYNVLEPPRVNDDPPMPSRDDRKPQFNTKNICHCECINRLGGKGEDRGDPDADNNFLRGDEGVSYEARVTIVAAPLGPVQSASSHFVTPCADFVIVPNGFSFGNTNIVNEDPFNASSDQCERAGTPDSLAMDLHGSEEVTPSSSVCLSRRSDSPGPVYNGVGIWTVDYYFTDVPLPLVPHWQMPVPPRFQLIDYIEVNDGYPDCIPSEDLDEEEESDPTT